ncbi:MAG: histidinol phosphate phosphatase HisJ family [Clostridia bacterium]|jgi:histidinol-phosphatase (PHP family)|nr:histidinol phosphate phosphatase HisJ family [Clostridia bacterium]
MSYLMDYHIHSIHSTDAISSISEICQSAVNKGINEIIITDHYEPSNGDELYTIYDQKSYWAEITKAKQLFKGKLKLKMGVELGQPHIFKEGSEIVMKDFPYDYVIASAHKLPDGRDMSELDYSTISIEDVCAMYLEQINMLIDWQNFDCVGHLDLIKRYSASTYGKNLSLTCQYELLSQVLRKLIASGKGIEINTSGLRQTPKETMPGLDVLTLYHQLGGEILTIGSDAHRAEDVGKGIREAHALAKSAGFRFITSFHERKPVQIQISDQKAFSASQR